MNGTKNIIEMTVLEYFLRVVKEHGYYVTFRKTFKKSCLIDAKALANPFTECKKIEEIISTMQQISRHIPLEELFGRQKYAYITMNINHLLHFFLERNGIKPKELCVIGEEIFNLVGHSLYGDNFSKENSSENIDSINDIGQLKSKLFQDYVDDMTKGIVHCEFEDYLKMNEVKIHNWMSNKNNDFLDNLPINVSENDLATLFCKL